MSRKHDADPRHWSADPGYGAHRRKLAEGWRRFRFDCPHCGEPWASPREALVDVHGGASIRCDECGGACAISVMPFHEAEPRAGPPGGKR